MCGDLRNKLLNAWETQVFFFLLDFFLAAFDDIGLANSGIVIHKNNVISSSGRRGMLRRTPDITVHKIKWAFRWYASACRIG